MSTEQILALLIQEREKLNRAIAALQGERTEAENPESAEVTPKAFPIANTPNLEDAV